MIKESTNPIGRKHFDLQLEFSVLNRSKNFAAPLNINQFFILS